MRGDAHQVLTLQGTAPLHHKSNDRAIGEARFEAGSEKSETDSERAFFYFGLPRFGRCLPPLPTKRSSRHECLALSWTKCGRSQSATPRRNPPSSVDSFALDSRLSGPASRQVPRDGSGTHPNRAFPRSRARRGDRQGTPPTVQGGLETRKPGLAPGLDRFAEKGRNRPMHRLSRDEIHLAVREHHADENLELRERNADLQHSLSMLMEGID